MSDDSIDSGHEQNNSEPRGYEAFKVSLRKSAIERISRRQKKKEYFDKFENKVTIATLLFVAGYTVITLIQLCVTRDQERRQLRAYVFIETAGGARDTSTGNVAVVINMKNFGPTPAEKLNGWIQFALGDNPQKEPLPLPKNQRIGESILAPTATQTLNFKLSKPVNPTEWSAVLVGSKAIFVWGTIFYDDAFGYERCSNFRLLMTGDDAREGKFGTDQTGNNENCNEAKAD